MPSEKRPAILVVDDEEDLRQAIGALLGDKFVVREAPNAEKALERLRTERVQCILLDLTLPGMDGFTFLERLHDRDLRIPVIVLTAQRSVQAAVQAMRLGAEDYITKPWNPEELELAVSRVVERARLVDRVEAYEASSLPNRVRFEQIICASPAMRSLLDVARRMCGNDSRILVTGETGTGKELLARAIHDNGPRAGHTFVAVNCAAIPAELAESEFFGHEKGSFTGAVRAKRGRFELAHEGTLFLDEVTCLTHDIQAKLLRVLQDGEVNRVGSEAPIRVDARVIAATNLDVRQEVASGHFREDLYYRLNVVPLHIPPLRERPEDIPLLLDHFRAVANHRAHKNVAGYNPEARRLLTAYGWPGNVRELEHTVERLVVLEEDEEIGLRHLPVDIVSAGEESAAREPAGKLASLKTARSRFEREYVHAALTRADWNQTRAAAMLGINRNTLIAKMQQYGLRASAPGAKAAARRDRDLL